jgi:hypothetical protein
MPYHGLLCANCGLRWEETDTNVSEVHEEYRGQCPRCNTKAGPSAKEFATREPEAGVSVPYPPGSPGGLGSGHTPGISDQ